MPITGGCCGGYENNFDKIISSRIGAQCLDFLVGKVQIKIPDYS